jgi:hypothetical protein
MMSKVNAYLYVDEKMFHEDFKTMIQNCKTYNSAETSYFRCALAVDARFDIIFRKAFPGT